MIRSNICVLILLATTTVFNDAVIEVWGVALRTLDCCPSVTMWRAAFLK